MIRVTILIADKGGEASVDVHPQVPKGVKPTPLEVAAWQELRGRIFAKVKDVKAVKAPAKAKAKGKVKK